MMTQEDFERGYAERSGISLERLKEYGLRSAPCDCGDPICDGWQMVWPGERAAHDEGCPVVVGTTYGRDPENATHKKP